MGRGTPGGVERGGRGERGRGRASPRDGAPRAVRGSSESGAGVPESAPLATVAA